MNVVPGGDLPEGFEGWGDAPIEAPTGHIYEDISRDDENFDFDLEVRVVDLNGNVSAPRVVNIASSTLFVLLDDA